MRALLLVALCACGKRDDGTIELARRDNVAEVAVGRVNADDVLDLIVVYQPTFKDPIGKRDSTMDAYDGATGATLWSTRLAGHVSERIGPRRRIMVTDSQVVIATLEFGKKTDLEPVIIAHDLATGRPLWRRQFEDAPMSSSFTMWSHDTLVIVPATLKGDADNARTLVALDAATGTERWSANVPAAGLGAGKPVLVDGSIVLLDEHAGQGALIDPASGAVRTVAWSERVSPIATSTEIYAGIDEPEYRRALAKLDVHSGTVSRLGPLPGFNSAVSIGPAIYRDLVLYLEDTGLVARRIGDDEHPVWTVPFTSRTLWDPRHMRDGTPQSTYFSAIPARYLPLLTEVGGRVGTLRVIDLDTGRLTWTSKPFPITLHQSVESGFIVVGTHYYVTLTTDDEEILVGFDGATGTFDAAYSIRIDEMKGKPDPDNHSGTPSVWSFQYGMLVGSWRNISWAIDLAKKKLAVVHPAGRATLDTDWSLVDAALGPVPRGLDLAPDP